MNKIIYDKTHTLNLTGLVTLLMSLSVLACVVVYVVKPYLPPKYLQKYEDPPVKLTIIDSTAYCACEKCCGEWSNGTFANGDPVGGLVVAADTKYYPMLTEIEIPGYGLATVKDRGGKIKGPHRLDVYFSDHEEALQWGHKYFLIYRDGDVYRACEDGE